MARGGRRQNAGRKHGSMTKKTADLALKAVENGQTPLEYMLEVMRSPMPIELSDFIAQCQERDGLDVDVVARLTSWHNMRFEAAKGAAPYMHPRLQAHEVSGKDGGPLKVEDVGNKELARRLAFLLAEAAQENGGVR